MVMDRGQLKVLDCM
jgi:hypothetical protein